MKRVVFLIHDLGAGGAEKVLVSLVNHMNQKEYDITVISLFGGGINEQFLAPHIKHYSLWARSIPGNSKLMKLLTPQQLHSICIKDHYDIEVAYLEGPSARIISGCSNPAAKLIGWIHGEQHTRKHASGSFRSYVESQKCYERFDRIVCVSETVRKDFLSIYPHIKNACVRYNTIENDRIFSMKDEPIEPLVFSNKEINLVAVGKITKNKGFDRLARIIKKLRGEEFNVHLYALGTGKDQPIIEDYIRKNRISDYYTFLGYHTNPYKYVARSDLFVCASLTEGFSTAAAEALIVGTPVCTVDVSGMKEMLGNNNEWGVVTKNNDDALYQGIKWLITDPRRLEAYKERALERRKIFSVENTVDAVEGVFEEVILS